VGSAGGVAQLALTGSPRRGAAPHSPPPPPPPTFLSRAVVMDLVMIASGFAGAVSSGLNATWPLFTFGCVALVPILYMLATGFSGRAGQGAPGVKSAFNTLMGLTIFVWAGYPIIVSVYCLRAVGGGRRGSAGSAVTWGVPGRYHQVSSLFLTSGANIAPLVPLLPPNCSGRRARAAAT
jgi:hypothetical protein